MEIFIRGIRFTKGTTQEKEISESFFANPFGPAQKKEEQPNLLRGISLNFSEKVLKRDKYTHSSEWKEWKRWSEGSCDGAVQSYIRKDNVFSAYKLLPSSSFNALNEDTGFYTLGIKIPGKYHNNQKKEIKNPSVI